MPPSPDQRGARESVYRFPLLLRCLLCLSEACAGAIIQGRDSPSAAMLTPLPEEQRHCHLNGVPLLSFSLGESLP